MPARTWCSLLLLCSLAGWVSAQAPEPIVANQNRTAAGNIENGVLTLHLELRSGAWHPEAEDGPTLYVQAFGEPGRPLQIPGPMVRVPVGTSVHVTVANKLKMKATIYGLNTRPGNAKLGLELAPDESRELTFPAGAPGTYYYWARTSTEFLDKQPLLADAFLNGAYIVDPPGDAIADRVFIIGQMFARADAVHKTIEVVTINGKSYPYTEPLEYVVGETIRWRVINPSVGEHPMHLHGSFFQLLSYGDFEQEIAYGDGERQSVVTQNLLPTQAMMMEWKPQHIGLWLFHCHFQVHISTVERVPLLLPTADSASAAPPHHHDASMGAMNDMAGLVLAINVKPTPGAKALAEPAAVRKIDLVIEPNAAKDKTPTFSCSVREGKKIVASEDKAMGPVMVLTRGEPAQITVLNHLDEPTTVHWHGLELDSYYDGVMGGGTADHVTPTIAPGASFTARFTPNRAGTFIYHTHSAGPNQLAGGVYGALIVLEPGEHFDPEHDKLLVVGTRDPEFTAKRITLNGAEAPGPLVLNHGVQYRLRVINMGSNLKVDMQLGSKEHVATWRAIAKDGAALPSRMLISSDAKLHIASGETYDFKFQPEQAGAIPLQIVNAQNGAALMSKIEIQ